VGVGITLKGGERQNRAVIKRQGKNMARSDRNPREMHRRSFIIEPKERPGTSVKLEEGGREKDGGRRKGSEKKNGTEKKNG